LASGKDLQVIQRHHSILSFAPELISKCIPLQTTPNLRTNYHAGLSNSP